ncbi:MAG: HD domain-containing protein [Chloroflexota bacterium]|nr:HD domain-containing protein [Chloroflexota bacterium]MDE2932036.1 HD domain-containing protein [Chloroflexota bacterium]
MAEPFEIRDPIHGFIELDEWERDIVNHPVFQRLRRIRQLGLTDMVYPGATHSRFEHSLGVMHVATKMFDAIVGRRRGFLVDTYNYDEEGAGLAKDRRIVRLAALLHDVGHAPFSHSGEDLMPEVGKGRRYKHENYSAKLVADLMTDVIEKHPLNQNYDITAQDVADFIEGKPADSLEGKSSAGRRLFWRNLVSGQLDADRADYLLRDSHHIGVAYGHYDLERLLTTLTAVEDPETGSPTLAIEEGGLHAAEGLIIARYMMFTQVYFHHTRRIYDHHLVEAMRSLLAQSKGMFPSPIDKEGLEEYLKWDDWRVVGRLAAGNGGTHGEIILNRRHDRRVYETPEFPGRDDLQRLEAARKALGERVIFEDRAQNSWYTIDSTDIPIVRKAKLDQEVVARLSERSTVVSGLRAVNRRRIYVPIGQSEECRRIVAQMLSSQESDG